MVHLSVQKFSEDFKTIYKRNNFSTPKNYLDFIKNYMNFLAQKRKMMDGMVRRLDGGLVTLVRAAEDTEELQKVLEVKNKDIAEKSVVVAELIKDIGIKSE
jgi:dynein heavy chain